VEAKLLQSAASLRTLFVLVISARDSDSVESRQVHFEHDARWAGVLHARLCDGFKWEANGLRHSYIPIVSPFSIIRHESRWKLEIRQK